MPEPISNDYWHYQRWCTYAADHADVLVLGDSVVRGQYVRPADTLPAQLTGLAHGPTFANLGLGGATPVAMAALVRYHGRALRARRVLVHLNPLWMGSPRTEMLAQTLPPQGDQHNDVPISHPRLMPQFDPRITGYRENINARIGVAVARHVPLVGLANHLRMVYFDGLDPARWTLTHPYQSPADAVTFVLPPPRDGPGSPPIPWQQRGLVRKDLPWGELRNSLQWEHFRALMGLLRARHNRVYVLVGPLNTHMLTPTSHARFRAIRSACLDWLDRAGVPYLAPDVLPTDVYGDASHPLAQGYRRLAQQLLADPAFQAWMP